jgi:hypothetical protein
MAETVTQFMATLCLGTQSTWTSNSGQDSEP